MQAWRPGVNVPVCIVWRDALFELDGSTTPPEDFIVRTFGHIVGESTLFWAVASELLPDEAVRAVSYIPKALVQDIIALQEGDRP